MSASTARLAAVPAVPTYPIGEVIAATTTGFTAQCLELPRPDALTDIPDPPPLGAWVRVGALPVMASPSDLLPANDDFDPFETPPLVPLPASPGNADGPWLLYGVVCHAETGAMEAGRPLTAFGLDENELRRAQPHLYELLATRFGAQLVAHMPASGTGTLRPYLPPRPPRPHAQVWLADDMETRRLTERLDYLRPLLLGESTSGPSCPADELTGALLRNAHRAWDQIGQGDTFLLRAGRELATVLARDYDRLRAILERLV